MTDRPKPVKLPKRSLDMFFAGGCQSLEEKVASQIRVKSVLLNSKHSSIDYELNKRLVIGVRLEQGQ